MSNGNSSLGLNEREIGGRFISHLNVLFNNPDYNWGFGSAGGEFSVQKSTPDQDPEAKTLFPDCVICRDKNCQDPIISMEFKLPDYPTEGHKYNVLYKDAIDKANRIGTNIFILYYFQIAEIFFRQSDGSWPKTPDHLMDKYENVLTTRSKIKMHNNLWHNTAKRMMSYLSKEINAKDIQPAPISFNIKNYVQTIADKLIPLENEYLRNSASIQLDRYIRHWARGGKAEFTNKKLTTKQAEYAFAKDIIIRWVNRIIFTNLLKDNQKSILNTLTHFCRDNNIVKFKKGLNKDVKTTDFFSILHVKNNEDKMPKRVVNNLADFATYLFNVHLDKSDSTQNERFVSRMLQELINTSKRKLMGLYTTPIPVAKFLTSLTILTKNGNFADFAVGSGTIAHQVYKFLKRNKDTDKYIHKHLWIADKYSYPLQVANLNITNIHSLGLENLSFQSNALDLRTHMPILITDPHTGRTHVHHLPHINYILSNLPFVESNNRSKDDRPELNNIETKVGLNNKIDLYQGILLHFHNLMSNHFRIGVITSNSWFRTTKGYNSFFKTMSKYYDIKDIIVTNVGRIFKDVKVVASIIILGPKSRDYHITHFIGLNRNLNDLNDDDIDELVYEIQNNHPFNNHYTNYSYSYKTIVNFINYGMSLEPLFSDLSWFKQVAPKLIPLTTIFKEGRGTRTGRDKLFLTNGLKTSPEDSTMCLKNLKDIKQYSVSSSPIYMITEYQPISKIMKSYHNKTIQFINNHKNDALVVKQIKKINHKNKENQKYNKGKDTWINAEQKPKVGDFVTELNPELRFFWVRLKNNVIANQRLILLTTKKPYKNRLVLLHALLNSIIPIFMLIASGFGRAQGAMDLNVNSVRNIYLLNPNLLTKNDENKIISLWSKLSEHPIQTTIFNELNDKNWIHFNKTILKAYGLSEKLYTKISNVIKDIIQRHESARKNN